VVVRRDHVALYSGAIGSEGQMIAYGHHGRPLLAFPSERGRCWDYEDRGPMSYVANLHGAHLEWLRARVSLLLVCGQGRWEDTTGALVSTREFAGLLARVGIPHEVDLWGHDVAHDWPSWRAQLAHHLPRFC
jgi:esterase/lipase superfamily enzyme